MLKPHNLTKHFPSSTREWNNSIYTFNKNVVRLIPSLTQTAVKLIKSYFNLYNLSLEKKIRKERLLLRLKRLSNNKIFLSNDEFKNTNNKVIITLYLYNKKYNFTYLQYIQKYLERLYNKNVEFNLVNLKRFYLHSDILSESISNKITNNRRKMLKYLNKLKRKVKIQKFSTVYNKPQINNNL